MNKSYRLIFNDSLGMFQVAPESSKAKLKGSKAKADSIKGLKRCRLSIISALVLSAFSPVIFAATTTITTTTTNSGTVTGDVGSTPSDNGGAGYLINNGSTIPSLDNTNSGIITGGRGADGGGAQDDEDAIGGAGGAGIYNAGFITTLINSGTITGNNGGNGSYKGLASDGGAGGAGGAGIYNAGFITTLTNTGTILGGAGGAGGDSYYGTGGAGGAGGAGISNTGSITTLTNTGTILGGAGGAGGYSLYVSGVGGLGGAGINNIGSITTLTNTGTILGGAGGAGVYYYFGGGASGAGGAGGAGISNTGSITTLTNTGTILGGAGGAGGDSYYGTSGAGGAGGAGISNTGSITTLTNTGTILGGAGGAGGDSYYGVNGAGGAGGAGINNTGGTIMTLENLQGLGMTYGIGDTASGPLTFTGALPTYYNIIATDPSNYGQLAVSNYTGTTTFGISSLSGGVNAVGSYEDIISGVATGDIDGTSGFTTNQYLSGTSNNYNYRLIWDGTNWDLSILSFLSGPTAEDTQASMVRSAYSLRGAYNIQSALINTSLNYDCTVFDKNGICLSTGGRFTSVDSPSMNASGALLIASYKAASNFRIGAYLDQNLSTNNTSGVRLSNDSPMGGIFAVWNQNPDRTGFEVRLAAGYSDKDISINRDMIGTSEAGSGKSSITATAGSATISYGNQLGDSRWIASPYAGIRYTKIKRDSYSENLTTGVNAPLSYAGLKQETTTALLGLRLNGQVTERTHLMGSIGLEQDLEHSVDNYSATGVDGIAPFKFNNNINRTRPVVSAGAMYTITPMQAVSLQVQYREEAFQSTGSASALATYQIGF